MLDEVTSVGLESQRNAGRQLELVKTRLATFLDAGGASKDMGPGWWTSEARSTASTRELEQRSLWGRTSGFCPSCETTRWSAP